MTAYSEASLIDLLGEPAQRGHLLGDGSSGSTDTPWATIKRVPLGVDQFMLWLCEGVGEAPSTGQPKAKCSAIRPHRGQLLSGSVLGQDDVWYVVDACPVHSNELVLTAFSEIFPVSTSDNVAPVSPKLLIVDEESYRTQTGDEWAEIAAHLAEQWTIILVNNDARFPGVTFVVVEKR